MAETIESFVQKLQTQGVQAGKQAAEELLAEAKSQSDRILQQAQRQADQLIADARQQARRLAEQQQNELELAARDLVLRLRDGVGAAVGALLQHEVTKELTDTSVLCKIIHDVVVEYAHEDARHEGIVSVNVNKESMAAVTDWAIKHLSKKTPDELRGHLDLKGTLKSRGFEYTVSDYTVEVTVESIVELLKLHMTPNLREVLDRATASILAQARQG